jgi:hypothetical protein
MSLLSFHDGIESAIPLTTAEKRLKQQLETIVERGVREFLTVGLALGELRAKRLYRTTHPTFEAYVKDRFGLSRSTVDGCIRSAQTAQALIESGIEIPPSVGEATIRPLSALPGSDLKAATWEFVQAIAPERMTQPIVSRICRIIKNALKGVDEAKAEPQPQPRHSDREQPFVRPVERLAAWDGFNAEIVAANVRSPSAETLYRACGVLAARCKLVQERLAASYPELLNHG